MEPLCDQQELFLATKERSPRSRNVWSRSVFTDRREREIVEFLREVAFDANEIEVGRDEDDGLLGRDGGFHQTWKSLRFSS